MDVDSWWEFSMARKPIVGVMGGGRDSATVDEEARQLGALIAERGWILLNGGGNAGVMAASAHRAKITSDAGVQTATLTTARSFGLNRGQRIAGGRTSEPANGKSR